MLCKSKILRQDMAIVAVIAIDIYLYFMPFSRFVVDW